MNATSEYFKFDYLEDKKVLIGKIILPKIDKAEAAVILDYAQKMLPDLPDYEHFILDTLAVVDVSNSAIGILMKSLEIVKKTKGYMMLVMTEKLLQKIMVLFPVMFDFYVVFHSINDAIEYALKEDTGS
jgi:hypothetical protein